MIEETNNNYVVYCHTTPDGMKYFGVTKSIKDRWIASLYKSTSLAPYIEKYGWDAITHIVVASCLTRDAALKLEDELICKARIECKCINKNRSGHHNQTDEYKDEQKVRRKAWKKAHPEKQKAYNKAYNKAWREAHPEEHKARNNIYQKNWRETHHEEYKAYQKAYQKAYREAHKDEINARIRENRKRKKGGGDKPEPLF